VRRFFDEKILVNNKFLSAERSLTGLMGEEYVRAASEACAFLKEGA